MVDKIPPSFYHFFLILFIYYYNEEIIETISLRSNNMASFKVIKDENSIDYQFPDEWKYDEFEKAFKEYNSSKDKTQKNLSDFIIGAIFVGGSLLLGKKLSEKDKKEFNDLMNIRLDNEINNKTEE